MRAEVGSEEEEEEEAGVEAVGGAWREDEGAADEWWRDMVKVEEGLGPVYFTRSSILNLRLVTSKVVNLLPYSSEDRSLSSSSVASSEILRAGAREGMLEEREELEEGAWRRGVEAESAGAAGVAPAAAPPFSLASKYV
jgi:hypothetical protein